MNRSYSDIIDRINVAPLWWQAGGVPRYDPFSPKACGVYASEAALVEIAAQGCETTFLVLIETEGRDGKIAADIQAESLAYGDPPNVDCCNGFCSVQTTIAIRVVEYWRQGGQHGGIEYVKEGVIKDVAYFEWQRDPSLEVVFRDPWGGGGPTPPRGERWKPAPKQ